ncbi:hypothetical protein [Rhodobacter sp. CZR27]|uniref:hypothetical protein n=1 Tax=Rhodobacter sp. CZR27 TaxID=2033869 RepID=UPI0018E0A092|nr:hypothetical protein [Rhodobacter sp. CZR27]
MPLFFGLQWRFDPNSRVANLKQPLRAISRINAAEYLAPLCLGSMRSKSLHVLAAFVASMAGARFTG